MILNHIESNHVDTAGGFQCDYCGERCPTRNALKMHKYRKKHKLVVAYHNVEIEHRKSPDENNSK